MRTLFAVLLILAATLFSFAGNPNVLLILVDDMGFGDSHCFNADSKIDTPNIDALAADGMQFTDAHAPGPLCHLSRYGLMTGTYPFRTNVSVWPKQAVIRNDEDTIAKLLSRNGYDTAMVGKWHLGFREDGYENPLPGGPVDRGFDSYFGIRASTDIPPYFFIRNNRAVIPPTGEIEANTSDGWSPIQGAFWRAGGIAPDLKLEEVTPRFTEEAVTVISQHGGEKPLFLYLAYPSPHTPWLPMGEFEGSGEVGMYGDFMTMVDAEIGEVLAALDDAGMTEDTLVIFTSDNGPVWYDEDVKRFGHDSVAGLRGMKSDAWEGGHRMPFVVRWPNVVEAGSVSDKTISFTDTMATLAEAVGEDLVPESGPDSYSFLSALKGAPLQSRPPIVLQSGGKLMTIRSGNWKLIEGLGSGGFSKPSKIAPEPGGPKGQLYNLAADPGETTNLYSERPDLVESLSKDMAEIVTGSLPR